MNQASVSNRKPVTLRGQRTRQHLLDAAEQVFGERGFEHASISEITRRAGVALGTFYVYFPHKQAIFIELVDELGLRLRQAINTTVKQQKTRLDKERAGFKAFFEFAGKHRNMYRIVRQAEFVDEAAYHRYYKTLSAAYAKGLEHAIAAGEVGRFEPEVLAWSLMGIADMVGMRFVLWDSPERLEQVTDEVFEFIRNGLLSPSRMSKDKEQK